MIVRQTKFATIIHSLLSLCWFSLAINYLFFEDEKIISGLLYAIIAVFYVIMTVYNWKKGLFRIADGLITRHEFPLKSKSIKIEEINWAKCSGSYYTLKSPNKKMTIELANVQNDDIPAFEKILKDIVMNVSPYKTA